MPSEVVTRARDVLSLNVFGQLSHFEIWSERQRAGLHDLFDWRAGPDLETVGKHKTKHDSIRIEDDAHVATSAANPLPDIFDAVTDRARRNVTFGDVADALRLGFPSLSRETGGKPVGLSGLVAVDVPEPQRLEPRRGPRAHVSLVVVAIDNDRPTGIEPLDGLSAERFQRNVDRPRNMFGLVLRRRKDVDQLRPLTEHALHLCDYFSGALLTDGWKPARCTAVMICSRLT